MIKSFDSVSATVIDVLRQFTRTSEKGNWAIEQHGEGAQASIFVVRRRDGRPIWQDQFKLIIKLYKLSGQRSLEVVRHEFESLFRLHAQLDASTAYGWRIASPNALFRCECPLAVVMTMVPGKPLKHCLRTADQFSPEVLDSIADAVIAAMARFWLTEGGLYGELNFDNILCDVHRKIISFVDPGGLEEVFLCDTVARNWFPASRDLAYLLYDIETSVRATIGNRGARQRQQCLAERILRAFVKKTEAESPTHFLLDEIGSCAQMHLKRITASWSPRGMWRLFVRQNASRGINQVLGRLRSDAVVPAAGLHVECSAGGVR